MLINERGPIEHRCPRLWSLATAAAAALAILAVAGLRADATPADEPKAQASQPAAPKAAPSQAKGETLHYTGLVKDKDTGKPIAGATVTVRRQDFVPKKGNLIIEESRHTTDAQGKYSFTIPPEQVAVPRLYIELDVEHPDYATQAGFGYALGMIRKNEKLGERPFFENIELRPAKPVLGRVMTPEGTPAEGVEIVAYSRSGKPKVGEAFEYGSFARTRTDSDGRFRVPITTPGMGIFWIMPRGFAPESHAIPEAKRGDYGTFHLARGVALTGRALDAQGRPLAGMFVEIERDRGSSPDAELLGQLMVSEMMDRRAETDSEGRFAFDPMPEGVFTVKPVDYQHVPHKGLIRRPLPGVFAPLKVTIKEGQTPEPIEIRATPHVVIEGGWVDSQGKPKSGWDLTIFGRIDGQFWHAQGQPGDDGKFSVQVPHGLEQVQVDISTNEHASSRHRVGKGGKLSPARRLDLGTLDHDVKDLEIIRYVAPIVIVKPVAKDGRALKDVVIAGEYTEENEQTGMRMIARNGINTDVHFEQQGDGKYRTFCLTPDRELKITAHAEGFQPASRKFKLAEGKTEEVTLVLEPK